MDVQVLREILRRYPELRSDSLPPVVTEMLRIVGVKEFPGAPSNPVIMGWRDELEAAGYEVDRFHSDEDPWCALGQAITLHRGGYGLPRYPLWAIGYAELGVDVKNSPMMGDIAVFERGPPEKQLGHVFTVIRVEQNWLHGIGANQGNAVNVAVRSRVVGLVGVRRPLLK